MVVLVHGLYMHGAAMLLLHRRLAAAGFRVATYSYPSMRLGFAANVERLARHCRALEAARLDFVAHSLGGLLVLRALEDWNGPPPGRVVLLGPPYADSCAARGLARWPGGRHVLGRCIPEWLDGPKPVPDGRYELGVTAGRRSLGLGRLVAPDLPRPNDGAVAVTETTVPGMREHIVLDVTHSGMLVSREVARQAVAFLRHGTFAHDRDA